MTDVLEVSMVEKIQELQNESYAKGFEDGKEEGLRVAQQSCDEKVRGMNDCISREDTLTAFADYVGGGMSMDDFDALWDIVAKMPSVTPTERTGHWILEESDNSIECDRCGCTMYANDILEGDAHYCPNCGAKMDSN